MNPSLFDKPWVLVRSASGLFAMSSHHVQEMVSTPAVTAVPQAPPYVRGVINLRGRVLPLVDLRLRFGGSSQAENIGALIDLLKAREQDHRKWVAELTASVTERRPFTLTTDPHACAFGKWYDSFHTDNLLLDTLLKRFDEPHKQIHAIGRQIVEAMAREECARCAALLAAGTKTLESLITLFAQVEPVLRESHREIAVVLKAAGPAFALAVDGIESVERLDRAQVSPIEAVVATAHSACVEAVARRSRDSGLVLVLDPSQLMSDRDTAAASVPA